MTLTGPFTLAQLPRPSPLPSNNGQDIAEKHSHLHYPHHLAANPRRPWWPNDTCVVPGLSSLVSEHQSYRGAPEEDEDDFRDEVDCLHHARGGDHAAVVGEDAPDAKSQSGDTGYDCGGESCGVWNEAQGRDVPPRARAPLMLVHHCRCVPL